MQREHDWIPWKHLWEDLYIFSELNKPGLGAYMLVWRYLTPMYHFPRSIYISRIEIGKIKQEKKDVNIEGNHKIQTRQVWNFCYGHLIYVRPISASINQWLLNTLYTTTNDSFGPNWPCYYHRGNSQVLQYCNHILFEWKGKLKCYSVPTLTT